MQRSQFNPFDLPAALAVPVVLIAFLPPSSLSPALSEQRGRAEAESAPAEKRSPLSVPPEGKLPVAIVLGKDAEVLDFCGPLEVFDGAQTKDGKPLFAPYMVAATMDPVTVSAGMKVVPDYTFKTAPAPKVIVIPAMNTRDASPEMYEWIRTASKSTDVTMSVCNGVFVLAKTGLLSGRRATSHHAGYFRFAGTFPDVQLKRGARFVEDGNLASAGGVSSGIDLALHVVERYEGREAAERVADRMEYQGKGWLDPDSNQAYSTTPAFDEKPPLCPLCLMEGNPAIKADYKGKTYHFCMPSEKEFFETHTDVLDRFLAEDAALRDKAKK
jgi:putative intracellular protease/amidase/YHS domain-containing protein